MFDGGTVAVAGWLLTSGQADRGAKHTVVMFITDRFREAVRPLAL